MFARVDDDEPLDMTQTPTPRGFEEIQQAEVERLYGRMVRARVWAAPLVLAIATYIQIFEPAPWRRVLAAIAAVLLPLYFVAEAWRFRRIGVERTSLPRNMVAAVVGLLTLSFATGGLESPIVAMLLPLGFIIGFFLPRRVQLRLSLLQAAALWLYAALAMGRVLPDLNPDTFGGGARSGHGDVLLVVSASLLTVFVFAVPRLGQVLRRAFDRMVRRALAAQEESLHAYAENAREMGALSAEIAHEIKNPLASVKGLAGLLARDLPDGKAAERLAVLRREVDRMQSILDEFLNFSRPLVPLTLQPVNLAALCAEVAALHEGMAHERGVRLELEGSEASARCDPRKVKQVLVNVVQNALEASPAGSLVEVDCSADAGRTRVRVLDRGRGLDAGLGARVFEPGVTTKARGSGLGLTIARALARQHGGELTLTAREGGGCVAELVLPREGPAPGEAEAA